MCLTVSFLRYLDTRAPKRTCSTRCVYPSESACVLETLAFEYENFPWKEAFWHGDLFSVFFFFFLLFLVLTKTLSEQYCIFASSFWVFPHKLEDSLYKLNTKPNGIYNEQKITVIGDILQLQQVKNFSEYMSIILACGCLMTVVAFANFLFSIFSNHYVAYL